MGADKPQISGNDTQTQTYLLPLFIGAVALVVAVVLFQKISFTGEGEAPKLKPQEEAKLQKRLKEIDEAEQYALIANEVGWYP